MKGLKEIRKEFWTEFLQTANRISDLYIDNSPTVNDWLPVSAGKVGIVYTCKVQQYATQVMVNIDNRPANDENEIFRKLQLHQAEIEKRFEEPLIWDQKEGRRIHRVRKLIEAGGYEDRLRWSHVAEVTIRTMLRLKNAIGPFINSLPS